MRLVVLLLLNLLTSQITFAAPTLKEKLDVFIKLVQTSEFEKARNLSQEITKKDNMFTTKDRLKFFHYSSRLESSYNHNVLAKTYVRKIFNLNPKYRLDPVRDLPEMVEYLDSLQTK